MNGNLPAPEDRPWLRAILSLAVVGVSLFVMIAKSEDEVARHWAVGVISFVLGYYLREGEPYS